MPASKDGDVQTDKSDGSKFITIKVASNCQVTYCRMGVTINCGIRPRLESTIDPIVQILVVRRGS